MSKEILYPDGKLLARGMVMLTPNQGQIEFDKTNFPFGLMKATDMDEGLAEEKASLFILAVGREGPPVAALKIPLKDVNFPFVFEITSDQLMFPYTPEAWAKTSNSKDSVALTAIVSKDDLLATPSESEWVGFAISNPVQIAGTNGRTTAKIGISSKINRGLYTEKEVENLATIDKALEMRTNPPAPTEQKATPSKTGRRS
jgi:hypothetical protein